MGLVSRYQTLSPHFYRSSLFYPSTLRDKEPPNLRVSPTLLDNALVVLPLSNQLQNHPTRILPFPCDCRRTTALGTCFTHLAIDQLISRSNNGKPIRISLRALNPDYQLCSMTARRHSVSDVVHCTALCCMMGTTNVVSQHLSTSLKLGQSAVSSSMPKAIPDQSLSTGFVPA
ncbi:hypothetical protein BU23DRAFT_248698 [Bimuria novae-zelandiae CBS 107.79]|uniref:Uncharacterized protein n=1 Tax=Bimuria novae-zelandiae CBS 107.79 TaxID=1447943 RepID=A0A6A5V1X6_9PLEO|nr:hypothetical protein BU23DRAFT_248698 [Bimuria novae-zelandiae CBS 107.79]